MRTAHTSNYAALELGIFLVSAVMQLLFLFTHPRLTDTDFGVVLGQPISDTERWHTLAADLASGRGLSGSLRAFYSMLLALVFVWTGPSVVVAKIVNIFLHSLSVSVASSIIARVFNLQAGLAAAAFMLLDFQNLRLTHALRTEHAGLCFFGLSIYFLLSSFDREKKGVRAFLSGAFLALSNLARPLTLLSAFVFVPYLVLHSEPRFRAGLRHTLLFGFGLLLCLTPWTLRQKITFGSYSISTNSMEAFWAATDPKWKTWSPEAIADARNVESPRSAAESEQFFRRKALSNLRQNPAFYLRNFSAAFWRSLDFPIGGSDTSWSALVVAGLILVVGALATISRFALAPDARGRGSSLAALLSLLTAAFAVSNSRGLLVLAGVAFSFLLGAPRVAILVGALFCTLLTNAAFALPMSRLNHLFDWLRLGFITFGCQQTLIWLFSKLREVIGFKVADRIFQPSLRFSLMYEQFLIRLKSARPLMTGGLVALITILIGSAVVVGAKNLYASSVPLLKRLSTKEKRAILLQALERNRDLIVPSDVADALDEKRIRSPRVQGRLVADVVELPYYDYHLSRGEKPPPDFASFGTRSYDYTILHVRSAIYGMRYVILPDGFSDSFLKRRAIIVARLHEPPPPNKTQLPYLEAINLIPIDPSNGSLDCARQIVANQPEHTRILQQIAAK